MENVQTSQASREPKQRRRIIPIVDARFQWKYTLLIMALGVGLTAIMGGFLYKAHVDNTSLLELAANPKLQAEVMRGDQIFLLYLIVLVMLMGVGLGFWGLIVTHRISGPLYIVASYLGKLASDNYPDMRPLRKRDELHDFFASFEEAVNALRNRDITMLRDIEGALADGDAKAAENALRRYRDTLTKRIGPDEGVPVD